MREFVVDFDSIPWTSPAPFIRFKAAKLGEQKLRLVEFAREFVEEDWCTKGHIGYLLEGEMEIDFDGTRVSVKVGDGILIPAGVQSRHRARILSEIARLILVEDA